MHARKLRCLVLVAAAALAVTGCGGDDEGADATTMTTATATTATEPTATPTTEATATPTTEATAATADGASIELADAWARESPMVADAAAVYVSITNAGSEADRLVAATVDPAIAGTVEVHETTTDDGAMDDGATDDGAMEDDDESGEEDSREQTGMGMVTMQEVEAVEVAAGETVALEPGGYHIMLIELAEPLAVGDSFDVTLEFERAGTQTVTAEVRDR